MSQDSSQLETVHYRPGLAAAVDDILRGARLWPALWHVAWQQVRSQYRRTILGPWWISLQRAVFIAGLAFLFGVLMGHELKNFVPFVAIGFVVFQFLTGAITKGTTALTSGSTMFGNAAAPISVPAFRTVASEIIQLAHDAMVVALALVIFEVRPTVKLVLLPIVVAMLLLNAFAFVLWLGPLNARFRDVGPLVSSVTGILFFFTPVFWQPSEISESERVALTVWNPLAHLLDISRETLTGVATSAQSWTFALVFTLGNVAVAFAVFARTRLRVIYWVQK